MENPSSTLPWPRVDPDLSLNDTRQNRSEGACESYPTAFGGCTTSWKVSGSWRSDLYRHARHLLHYPGCSRMSGQYTAKNLTEFGKLKGGSHRHPEGSSPGRKG
jgi:hypothetical protein